MGQRKGGGVQALLLRLCFLYAIHPQPNAFCLPHVYSPLERPARLHLSHHQNAQQKREKARNTPPLPYLWLRHCCSSRPADLTRPMTLALPKSTCSSQTQPSQAPPHLGHPAALSFCRPPSLLASLSLPPSGAVAPPDLKCNVAYFVLACRRRPPPPPFPRRAAPPLTVPWPPRVPLPACVTMLPPVWGWLGKAWWSWPP